MINSIKTQYFETHIDTEIELHPGVNTFVGESDEGKSGIVRQIKWNSRNRPNGDGYRNDQLDPKKKADKLKATVVGIDYKDSAFVVRARDGFSGGVNNYQIDDTEPLRALRMDVPDEVQEITRMKDVNIQGQHPTEQYFLLADNPGQVAKKFNKVAGLTVMDSAIKSINSKVRTCNTEIGISKTEIENKEKELKDTEWILKAEKFAKKLSSYEKKMTQKRIQLNELSNTILRIENISTNLQEYDGLESAKTALGILSEQRQAISKKQSDLNTVSCLIIDIKKVDLALQSTEHTEKALSALKELKTLRDNINKNDYKIKEISVLIHKLELNQKESTKADIELIDSQAECMKIKREKECPTCGRKGI